MNDNELMVKFQRCRNHLQNKTPLPVHVVDVVYHINLPDLIRGILKRCYEALESVASPPFFLLLGLLTRLLPVPSTTVSTSIFFNVQDASHPRQSSISNNLCSRYISMGGVPALRARMNSILEFFFSCVGVALRANLRCVILVYFTKVHTTLPAHPFEDINELSKSSILGMFPKHTLRPHSKVDILNKNHSSAITQLMGNFKVPV